MIAADAAGLLRVMTDFWPGSKRNNPDTLARYGKKLLNHDARDAAAAVSWAIDHGKDIPPWCDLADAIERAREDRLVREGLSAPRLTDGIGRTKPDADQLGRVHALRDALAAKLRGELNDEEFEQRKDLALRRPPRVVR